MSYLALDPSFNIGDFSIRYYAIFIIVGAIIAYMLSRYFNRKAGYDDTILEGTFYLAFPLGIIGARIWYVIAQWSAEFANETLTLVNLFGNYIWIWKPLAIWQGGLAIQGGAILGIASGMLYVHHKKPDYNVLAIADLVVPNILIAQALGRWGNFFNQEVYGQPCEVGGWSIFGQWFVDQMTINGQFRTPLFLIESILNILGFFIIMFGVRKLLKKYLKPGDLIACYLIWYGLIRAILEPLRDNQFQMGVSGNNVQSSFIMAISFIIVGIILIVVFHNLDKILLLFKKNNNVEQENKEENSEKESSHEE